MINNPNLTYNYGWVCPLCGRALSPTTTCCPCHNEHKVQETGTTLEQLCGPQTYAQINTDNVRYPRCPKCGGTGMRRNKV